MQFEEGITPGTPEPRPATRTASGQQAKRPHRGLSGLAGLAGVATAVGLVMVLCTAATRTGLYLLVFGLPVAVASGIAILYQPSGQREATRRVLLVVIWAALTAGLAGAAGQIVRWADAPDYYGRYGNPVTATLPDECNRHVRYRSPGGNDWKCRGSTWELDGVKHSGTIVLGKDDIFAGNAARVPDRAEARVIGDKGYSVKRTGSIGGVVIWGRVPAWLLLGLPLFVAALLRLAFLPTGEPAPAASGRR